MKNRQRPRLLDIRGDGSDIEEVRVPLAAE